jgi:hypothetical protein
VICTLLAGLKRALPEALNEREPSSLPLHDGFSDSTSGLRLSVLRLMKLNQSVGRRTTPAPRVTRSS